MRVRAGAAAVVCGEGRANVLADLPVVVVDDVAAAAGHLAAVLARRADRTLELVGVTGTNGKTSCTYLLEASGRRRACACGVVGTIVQRCPGVRAASRDDHAVAVELQAFLAELRDAGARRARSRSPLTRSPSAASQAAVSRRDLHQPHARPPRLPLRRGSYFAAKAAAVHAPPRARQRRGDAQRRRSARGSHSPRARQRAGRDLQRLRRRARGRTHRCRSRRRRRRPRAHRRDGARHSVLESPVRRGQPRQHRGRRGRARSRPALLRKRSAAGISRCPPVPGRLERIG